MLNLSVICPDTAVKVAYVETKEAFVQEFSQQGATEDTPYVFSSDEKEGSTISFNLARVQELYEGSWLRKYVNCEVLIEGFIIKELAKIRYTVQRHTFDEVYQAHIIKSKQNPLYAVIYELLFAFMAEYNLCYDFPELSRQLELLHSAVVFSSASKLRELGADYKAFVPYMQALERLLRYNSLSPEVSTDFLSFCLPFCLVAKRTNYRNVIEAALLIESWLTEATPLIVHHYQREKPQLADHKNPAYDKDVRSVSEEELEDIDRNAKLLSVKSKLEDVAKEVGLQAGTGKVHHHTNDTNMFFLDTVRKYRQEISELEYMFKRTFTSMKIVDAFDGDVNMQKQQAAYLASLTKEETKVFQYYQKKKVSVDIIILRDVSGSTYLFEKEYAEGIIEILAAVNNFPGIRTLEIDFGGEAIINKDFSQTIEMSSIYPQSGGGTSILPALRLLRHQSFKGKRRLLFILSDGEINDLGQAEYELTELCRDNGLECIKIALGELANHGYEYTPIRELHRVIAKKILERGVSEDA